MDFLELVRSRWSVRDYDARPVEQEKVDRILEAGRLAPTGANRQPQRIYVLQSEEALAAVRAATRMAFNAPLVLMVCAKVDEAWHNQRETVMRGITCDTYNVAEMDASIVCDHMQLAATELGLGTLWVRGYNTQVLLDAFDLPEGVVPMCLLDVGYPSQEAKPSPMHASRKPIGETVVVW
ncbi:MAG: nitroreductase family protein [Coriobacteriales bacterium]|nr:nitroreductase family protein [Coriobacteriales bacterium]